MYVYVVKSVVHKSKEVKIGYTKDLDARLKQLQTASPYTLKVHETIPCTSEANARWVENCIHKEFSELRLSGEWFRWTANLGNFIRGLKEHDPAKQDRALEKHKAQVARGHFRRR